MYTYKIFKIMKYFFNYDNIDTGIRLFTIPVPDKNALIEHF